MPDVNATPVAFEEAIAFLRGKVKLPTARADAIRGAVHAKAFTVAGATKAQLLNDLHQAVKSAIENGQSIGEFRKAFDQVVADHGWSYKGRRGWRTRVIYDTNMRTARMAGKWQIIQRTKTRRPYLQYRTAGDTRVRPEHRRWDAVVLPVDDDWWSTHFPPNGWGCRCTVRTLSQRQMERRGLTVSTPPRDEKTERINTRTGEVYGDVPEGIDTGWDYNVGQAWLAPERVFGDTVAALPPVIRNEALEQLATQKEQLVEPFKFWATEAFESDRAGSEIVAGYLSRKTFDFLDARQGIQPSSVAITVSDFRLRRMRRDVARRSGKAVLPTAVLLTIPERLARPVAVLWDKEKRNLVYVTSVSDDNRFARLAVEVDFVRKGQPMNTVVSGALIPLRNLGDATRYEVVEGQL